MIHFICSPITSSIFVAAENTDRSNVLHKMSAHDFEWISVIAKEKDIHCIDVIQLFTDV